MALQLVCGMECASLGLTGGHLPTTFGTAPTLVSSPVRTGLRALRCAATNAASGVRQDSLFANQVRGTIRVYFRFNSFPTGDVAICFWGITLGNFAVAYFRAADSSIYAGVDNVLPSSNLSATGFPITTGQWYLLDFHAFLDDPADTVYATVSVDGGSPVTASKGGITATSMNNFGLGCLANPGNFSYEFFLDDELVGHTDASDFPFGPGYVQGAAVDGDGTHNTSGTTIRKGTTASPNGAGIDSSTTDAYQWQNAKPPPGGTADNTRLINQGTASTTSYAELTVEDLSGTDPIRAVELLAWHRQGGTGAGNQTWRTVDSAGNTLTDLVRSGGGSTSDRAARTLIAAPGGGWTVSNFNGIRLRYGFSSDATPAQYTRGIVYEVERTIVPAAPPMTPNYIPGPVMRRRGVVAY